MKFCGSTDFSQSNCGGSERAIVVVIDVDVFVTGKVVLPSVEDPTADQECDSSIYSNIMPERAII